jgi:hypothetical protein
MSNAMHSPDWDLSQDDVHPAGEMALTGKPKIAARTRALAGLALVTGTLAVVVFNSGSTSVSTPGALG